MVQSTFAYGTFTLFGGAFQPPSAQWLQCPTLGPVRARHILRVTPNDATAHTLARRGFGLLPRSLATTSGIGTAANAAEILMPNS